MTNSKLQSQRSITAVCNFQRFSYRSFVSAFELIFILKLDWTVKCNFQNTKDHHSNKYYLTICSTASIRVLEANEYKEMYITRKMLTN